MNFFMFIMGIIYLLSVDLSLEGDFNIAVALSVFIVYSPGFILMIVAAWLESKYYKMINK